jgi:hypothetical protein
MPATKDYENHVVSVTAREKGKSILPIFVTLDNLVGTLEIAPLAKDTPRIYDLEFILKDSLGAQSPVISSKL